MNLFIIVGNYLKVKPLNTVLNILLLSLGIGVITILLLFNKQLQEKINQNAESIDLVVGAKGSPLQLILCNIFHIDFPTGNIKLAEAERIAKGRLVKSAIPLALGDSYQGFRIVGTTKAYAELYQVELAQGDWWHKNMDVTLGASVAEALQLKMGSKLYSTHGLMAGGHAHEQEPFIVKGILKRANNVIDNLILTNVESIWEVHEEHQQSNDEASHNEAHNEENEHVHEENASITPSPLVPSISSGDSTKEITSLLIQYRSPMAAIQLPRIINGQTNMQAASPAFETARLFTILGVGVDIFMGFATVLIIVSALSIFIALYNSLRERRYDLAIMRSMGATRLKLFIAVLMEGMTLTLLGCLTGLLIGHAILVFFSTMIEETKKAGINGLVFYQEEWIILAGSLFLGMICALLPSLQAYRTNISKVLANQ